MTEELRGDKADESVCPGCITWARTDGRLTNHHPHCPAFVEKLYMRISRDGGGTYLQPLADLHNALDGELDGSEAGDKWELELVKLTEEEHARLPEFEGH